MSPLDRLRQAGQSIWYDNIRRGLLESGELARYLRDYAVTGVTSNPTIFERAIGSSSDYDDGIQVAETLVTTVEELFFALAVDDIEATADVLRPVHDETGGLDGYVSLEVSPTLAHDAGGYLAMKYLARGWWQMRADVVCSGWNWKSSLTSTPMRSTSSSSATLALSSRSGHAG